MDKLGSVGTGSYLGAAARTGEKIAQLGYEGVKGGVQTTLDEFIPGRKYSKVDIKTDNPNYTEVSKDDAAVMIGYFTQKMEEQGFPWAVYKPNTGFVGGKKGIGEFEALMRLEKGESVVFQPNRVIGLGFNPPQFKTKDAAGQESQGKVDMKAGGMEVHFGVPVEIKNKAELKFLYELYNPDIKIEDVKGDKLRSASRELAFFTKGTMAGQYPWKMYKNEGALKKVWNMVKGGAKSAVGGGVIGAIVTSVFTIPAMALGATGGPIGVAAGVAIGAAIGAFLGVKDNRRGTEINAFETLARLKDNQPVYFQEKKKREIGLSIPFPIGIQLGSLSSYTDHGEGSEIQNLDELKLFHSIQEQKEEPEEKKDAKKAKG